jgi:hypothetical protein
LDSGLEADPGGPEGDAELVFTFMLSYQEWQIDAPMQLELAREPLDEFLLAAAISIDTSDPALSRRVVLQPGERSGEQELSSWFHE